MKNTKGKCPRCNGPMTWSEQRRQYGRLAKHGMSPEQIKPLMPRCYRCITAWLRDRGSKAASSLVAGR